MVIVVKIVLVISFVICVPCIYFFGGRCTVCHDKGHVIHYYWEQIGIPGVVKYDYIIKTYGDPDEIEYTRSETNSKIYYNVRLKYNSLDFLFSGDDKDNPTTWNYYGIAVKDKSVRFNNHIHVGLPKWWIEWKFRHQLKVKEDPNSYWAFGYTEMLEFTYDEHNRVSSITFYR